MMTMRLTVALPAALCALAGCMAAPTPYPPAPPQQYAPYDYQSNPYCGVLNNCQPLNTYRYPLRGWGG